MSYCINPYCSKRLNLNALEVCQTCGTKLLINERYRIVQPLRVGQCYNSEVFEVKDFHEQGTSKVLKCLAAKYTNSKIAELFEKEAQALIWLSSEWQKHPGIPKVKPDGYFTFGIDNGVRKLQCLVMEKIEGQDLEHWLYQHQPISQKQALNWLQQLVEILDKVHRQGLWHRDIKPSNIMLKPDGQLVLIDFGSIGIGETRIISAEYTPPEQVDGKTVLQSDFFALGRTFVFLLTGEHPIEFPKVPNTEQLIWRERAPQISSDLASLLDDLMAPSSRNRPQNTQDIFQRLSSIDRDNNTVNTQFNKTISISSERTELPEYTIEKTELPEYTTQRKPKRLGVKRKLLVTGIAIVIVGLTGTVIYQVLPCQMLGNLKLCLPTPSDNLSFGEKILVPGSAHSDKKAGVEAIAAGDYTKAVTLLERSRQNQINDPETLIYLNNARIEQQKAKAYTIAIVVPLSNNFFILNSGLEILRGVAHAQDEINRGNKIKGMSLRVAIANDNNDSNQAKKIAEELGNNKDILAVIGHSTSDVTVDVVGIYQRHQLVSISPTSSSDNVRAKIKSKPTNFFFRTVPSDPDTTRSLTDYLLNNARREKVAIFYNPNSPYSLDLRNQLNIDLSSRGGKVVEEFDLSNFLFDADRAIDKAQKQGVTALVLLPDTLTRPKTLAVVTANSRHSLIVGGGGLYSPDLLTIGNRDAVGSVIAIPWHSSSSPNREFPKAAEKLWAGSVSWRTALAYDATRALIAALEKNPVSNRILLQKALSNPNFYANGATGAIHFSSNGDRKEPHVQLVQVSLDDQGKPIFLPFN